MVKINKYIQLVCLLAATTVFISTYYSISNTGESIMLAQKAFVSQHQISRIERMLAITADADEGVKNYIITGDEKFLIPADSSYARINRTVKFIHIDLKDDSSLSSNIPLLEKKVNDQVHFMSMLVAVRKKSFDSAQKIVSSGIGIVRMDSIKALVNRMSTNERIERTQYTDLDQVSINKTTIAIVIGELIAFLMILFVLLRLNSDMLKRVVAEKLLKESEIRYRAIAQNVGSFIYTCDYYGKVTFATPNIVLLTGYTSDEIIGKHFTFMVAPEWIESLTQGYYTQFKNKIKETTTEFEIITKKGERKRVEQDIIVFSTEDATMGFQCMIRDMSNRGPIGSKTV